MTESPLGEVLKTIARATVEADKLSGSLAAIVARYSPLVRERRVFVVLRKWTDRAYNGVIVAQETALLHVASTRALAQAYIDVEADWPDKCEIEERVVDGKYDEGTGILLAEHQPDMQKENADGTDG